MNFLPKKFTSGLRLITCEIRDVKVADVVVCVVAQEDLATGVRKDEVAEVQVEQAERGRRSSKARAKLGAVRALLLAAMRSLRALVCRQVLTDLSQRTRRIKFLMN